MKYKYLNEVLLNWNSDKDLQDNNIIKSSDIKKEISDCFIYKIEDKPSRICIFNVNNDPINDQTWEEYEKYKDKVYINGKHVELIDGETVDTFNPGEYRIYIEDIDQVEDTGYMFYKCHQLVKAYIPSTVTYIGNNAFQCCSGLTSVDIPNSVISINNQAFYECTSLTSVTIGNSVRHIGEIAFSFCSNLTSITIPNSVTYIGYGAFYKCSGLTSITIGNSVTSIGGYVFASCSGLTTVNWNAKSCPDFSYKTAPFIDLTGITSFNFGNEVEHIPAYLCYNLSHLTSMTIGNSVTSIGDHAFDNCRNIQTVYVEDINKFNQIKFGNESSNPLCYGAKLIELQNYEI